MRAQVVLLDGDRILMARHRHGDTMYWVLPGGAVEPGETPEQAAVREVVEETGLQIRVDRLLFVEEPHDGAVPVRSPRHTFLGSVLGGRLARITDTANDVPGGVYLDGAEWMPLEHPEYDAATLDTLQRVRAALTCQSPGTAG